MPNLNVTIIVPQAEQLSVTADFFHEPHGIVIEGTSDHGGYTLLMPRAAAELLLILVERALAELDDPEMQEIHK